MIFHYNELSGITSLDPAFAKNQSNMWAVHQIYNKLVETDSNLNIVPSIASHWQISNDATVFTFYLRNDIFFHDDDAFENGKGRKLVANDVVYSFKRIIDKKTASPGAWIFNGRVDTLQPFTAINDSIFQLKLLKPFQPILGILSMQYCSIVPKEVVEKYGTDFRRHPCGTGAFKFRVWEEGQTLILQKNENYFEKDEQGKRLPYLDGIKVSFIDSKATEFLEFRQARLDFINDIDPSFKDEILTKTGELKTEWKGKIILNKHPYLNIEYFGILINRDANGTGNKALQLKKIRQAINYGFDRNKMMLYLRNSIGTPACSGFAPAGLPSYDSSSVKGFYYDPALAKQLIKEAGYSNSSDWNIKIYTIDIYADFASFIARQLEEIGLDIEVEVVKKSLLLQMTANSNAPFFRGSWIADYPDAENFLSVFYSKNPAPPNYTRYKNEEFDKLYEQAIVEINDSIRYELYRKMDRIILEDAPVVPLWYDMAVHLVQPNVQGFKPNGLNLLELRRVKLHK